MGGRILKRRRTKPVRPRRRPMPAATKRLMGLLVAAGSVLLGVRIPSDAAAWLATGRGQAKP